MKILIFGAGGIGSVLGGFLARMGHEVSLLGRRKHLDVIARQGLTITGLWGDYRVKAFDLYESSEELLTKALSFDFIFLTVKSYDTRRSVDEIIPLMGDRTTLVSFQNGLGNIEAVLERIRPERFLPGRAIFGVDTEPGKVNVTVQADDLVVGALPGVRPLRPAAEIAHILTLAKIRTRAVPDILTYVWSKVIYNCALNGICTLMESPYGKILETEETRRSMCRIVQECYAVAAKKGVALQPPTAEGYIDLLTRELIPKTRSHYPSMLQDIRKGRRTEIDALNGAICLLGTEFSVETPENQRVADEIRRKEKFAIS